MKPNVNQKGRGEIMIPACKVTAYKCYFCGGHLRRNKKSVLSHSQRCFSNPARKACRTCAFLKFDSFDEHGGKSAYCEREIDIDNKWKFDCNQWGLKP